MEKFVPLTIGNDKTLVYFPDSSKSIVKGLAISYNKTCFCLQIEFFIDDIDVIYNRLKMVGFVKLNPPYDTRWGGRQLAVMNPAGFRLQFTQLPR